MSPRSFQNRDLDFLGSGLKAEIVGPRVRDLFDRVNCRYVCQARRRAWEGSSQCASQETTEKDRVAFASPWPLWVKSGENMRLQSKPES